MSEHLAAVDLLGLGYEVFGTWDHTASADLIIRSPGDEVFFVEVKTANRGRFIQASRMAHKRYDILALVNLDTRSVQYMGAEDKLWGDTPLNRPYRTIQSWGD